MIYENIAALASQQNITIQKVEKECGLSAGLIGKWKENNNPKIDNLLKVANFFHVSVTDLLKDESKVTA